MISKQLQLMHFFKDQGQIEKSPNSKKNLIYMYIMTSLKVVKL